MSFETHTRAYHRDRGRVAQYRALVAAAGDDAAARKEKSRATLEKRVAKHLRQLQLLQLEKEAESNRCMLCEMVRAEALGLGHANWAERRCGTCWQAAAERSAALRHATPLPALPLSELALFKDASVVARIADMERALAIPHGPASLAHLEGMLRPGPGAAHESRSKRIVELPGQQKGAHPAVLALLHGEAEIPPPGKSTGQQQLRQIPPRQGQPQAASSSEDGSWDDGSSEGEEEERQEAAATARKAPASSGRGSERQNVEEGGSDEEEEDEQAPSSKEDQEDGQDEGPMRSGRAGSERPSARARSDDGDTEDEQEDEEGGGRPVIGERPLGKARSDDEDKEEERPRPGGDQRGSSQTLAAKAAWRQVAKARAGESLLSDDEEEEAEEGTEGGRKPEGLGRTGREEKRTRRAQAASEDEEEGSEEAASPSPSLKGMTTDGGGGVADRGGMPAVKETAAEAAAAAPGRSHSSPSGPSPAPAAASPAPSQEANMESVMRALRWGDAAGAARLLEGLAEGQSALLSVLQSEGHAPSGASVIQTLKRGELGDALLRLEANEAAQERLLQALRGHADPTEHTPTYAWGASKDMQRRMEQQAAATAAAAAAVATEGRGGGGGASVKMREQEDGLGTPAAAPAAQASSPSAAPASAALPLAAPQAISPQAQPSFSFLPPTSSSSPTAHPRQQQQEQQQLVVVTEKLRSGDREAALTLLEASGALQEALQAALAEFGPAAKGRGAKARPDHAWGAGAEMRAMGDVLSGRAMRLSADAPTAAGVGAPTAKEVQRLGQQQNEQQTGWPLQQQGPEAATAAAGHESTRQPASIVGASVAPYVPTATAAPQAHMAALDAALEELRLAEHSLVFAPTQAERTRALHTAADIRKQLVELRRLQAMEQRMWALERRKERQCDPNSRRPQPPPPRHHAAGVGARPTFSRHQELAEVEGSLAAHAAQQLVVECDVFDPRDGIKRIVGSRVVDRGSNPAGADRASGAAPARSAERGAGGRATGGQEVLLVRGMPGLAIAARSKAQRTARTLAALKEAGPAVRKTPKAYLAFGISATDAAAEAAAARAAALNPGMPSDVKALTRQLREPRRPAPTPTIPKLPPAPFGEARPEAWSQQHVWALNHKALGVWPGAHPDQTDFKRQVDDVGWRYAPAKTWPSHPPGWQATGDWEQYDPVSEMANLHRLPVEDWRAQQAKRREWEKVLSEVRWELQMEEQARELDAAAQQTWAPR